MAHTGVDPKMWIPKLFLYCGNGASVVQGENWGVIRILGDLQQALAGYDVIVLIHASCHRCDFAFKAAVSRKYHFLDLLSEVLQSGALFCDNAPARLKTLQGVAEALDVACLK